MKRYLANLAFILLSCIAISPTFGTNSLAWITGFIAVTWLLTGGLIAVQNAADHVRRLKRLDRGRCPACGYDVRGDLSERCPECGWQQAAKGAGSP